MEAEHLVSNEIVNAQLEDFQPMLAVDQCNTNTRVPSAQQGSYRQSVADKITVQFTQQTLNAHKNVQPHTIHVQSADKELVAQKNVCRSIVPVGLQQQKIYSQSVVDQVEKSKAVTESLTNVKQQNICVKPAETAVKPTAYESVERPPSVRTQSADQTVPQGKVVRPVQQSQKIRKHSADDQQTVRRPVPRNTRAKPADQSVDAQKRVGRPYVPIQPRNTCAQSVVDLTQESNACVQPSEPIVLLCAQSADEAGNVVFVGDIVLEEECCSTAVAEEIVVSEDSSSYCQDTDDSDVEMVESPSLIVKNLSDEVQSDNGYESIGSPDSDVNTTVDLRQLFPELW